ncbi:MAG: hypothetical protein ACOYW9_01240 [Deinococcota bacterium]|jgi:hypothetical protein|uniref:Uncharacterized protein n=1 Tax=Allomeiothermus silvanus (strain ATCC 700542 / DSM 9946 / NBRC 106475 / NCIMB 13440 / VI-R2) TaxID=526227 RepID=D7BF87_ALLS1|nr:hypothetical protein [Allomeiothermus silvanus]ADH63440.1 hypothetical protein Mesil_1550 [Allomeiothermus silvanus DSM 9946]MBI5812383.1 hypothetical protein [Allomeiothermus silvanus]MCL6568823.1 hypothetical protein [Allomeiothermus silvanus]
MNPEPEIKPDWKDFLALVIAAYQVLLLPVLLIFGSIGLVVLIFGWMSR